MSSKHNPVDSLADIIEFAEHIQEYLQGLDEHGFEADRRTKGNRLRHAYDSLDEEAVWFTATVSVPNLATAAREALARLEGSNAPRTSN